MTTGRVLAIVAVALLAACNSDSTPSPVVAKLLPKAKPRIAPAPAKRGPTPEEMTVGMVEAVSLAKSNVPVGMKFQLSERPAMGKPLDVVVALLPQEQADSATVGVSGSEGLEFAAGTTALEIPTIEAGQVYKESFAVTPTTEGVHLLTLTVAMKHDESSESRSFAVPLIVAPAAGAQSSSSKRPGP
jgi:hypothetical protein